MNIDTKIICSGWYGINGSLSCQVGRWYSLRSLRASHPFMASERAAKPAPRTRVSFRGISRDSDELAVRL